MRTMLISGPAPIVTPADIVGSHAADDPKVIRMISAVQRSIQAPSGWLGRVLGQSTLELWLDSFPCDGWISLYGPVVSVTSVKYLDPDEVEQTVDAEFYRRAGNDLTFRQSFSIPATLCARDAVRIRYVAGYNGTAVTEGGTGPVPEEAKEAVILGVQQVKAISVENLFLRSEEVEGVGTFQYTVSDQAGEVIRRASENLLQGLRVYS
ncbi:hypothetical protein OIU34_00625 [Pararhizobium sp. BT-229]|uniref:hypothetical protein n=1 Tax=Pararhizobium sp. BT-229 TaxID=2986923 RepID=UPI0021F77E18|nr:hypothetical protein [Pararhizobium sp. BT-229]MCV9960390.1 hypothetical protein [Pararhizobium sp. BT-229]